MRTKVSPSVALRRWPMCAALLGLILVCSTMIFSPESGAARALAAQQARAVSAAVEPHVEVAVAGDFDGGDAFDRADLRRQFRRDLLRRLPQLLGELERRRHRQLAELALLRLLDGYRQIDAVAGLNVRMESARNSVFQWNGTRETTSIT